MPTKTKAQIKKERAAVAARRKINRDKKHDLNIREAKIDDKIDAQTAKIKAKTAEIKKLKKPLNARAFDVAETLLGVMEMGGNNTGPKVNEIIRANSGAIGEPWCGDFDAFCYRKAGSKKVDRNWASVNALQSGNSGDLIRTVNPQQGDVVCFSFGHTGLFDKWINRAQGTFRTIEGNTGKIGAVSDSLTGGDGVYRKNRSMKLGVTFWRVTG